MEKQRLPQYFYISVSTFLEDQNLRETEGFLDVENILKKMDEKSKGGPSIINFQKLSHWINHQHTVKNVVYDHHEPIDKQGKGMTCDELTDAWWKWALRTPGSSNPIMNPSEYVIDNSRIQNAFLMKERYSEAWFVGFSPFKKEEVVTINMLQRRPLLIPCYNMEASVQDYPGILDGGKKSVEDQLLNLVMDDLSGVTELSFEIDRKKNFSEFDPTKPTKGKDDLLVGCTVVRKDLLKIENVPPDNILGLPVERLGLNNSIDMLHGGFWLLLKEDVITRGEHLIEINAKSRNYELSAKIHINAIF